MDNKKYKYWSWKKDASYVSQKSYRYTKDIKSEIEHEIIKIEENKRAQSSNRLAKRPGVIQTISNPFLKSDYIKDLETQSLFLRPKDSNDPKKND
jgi:hypothetical protein